MSDFSGNATLAIKEFVEKTGQTGIKQLVGFVGVESQAVEDWSGGGRLPKGTNLISLRCFLSLAGYLTDEFEDLPLPAQRLTLVLGLGLVDLETVRTRLEYKNIQDVYRIVLQGSSLAAHRQRALARLLEEHSTALREKMELVEARLAAGEVVKITRPRVEYLRRLQAADESASALLDTPAVPANFEPVVVAPQPQSAAVVPASSTVHAPERRVVTGSVAATAHLDDRTVAAVASRNVQSLADLLRVIDASPNADQLRHQVAYLVGRTEGTYVTESLMDFWG